MYPVSPQAYDRAITVFSPDGRLFQVEYAKEAVKRGATAIGITYKGGVALVSHKIIQSPLVVPKSMKKIFEIDTHIYTTASGLIADARRLIDYARSIASSHRMTYDEPPSVIKIAREISDTLQVYTQYGGIRPFGVSLLIAGVDKEPELYEVEPSGALTGYTAAAIGRGKKVAEELLEKKIPVIVFDPTGQWTGFVKPCRDKKVLKYYRRFGLSKEDAKYYPGMIYEITDPNVKIDFKKYVNPGEITVFVMNKLKPGEYDTAVINIIDTIFSQPWEESTHLKLVVAFDEVHRLLEKYGGKGGYIALERACREFRKWGIGLIMVSQVLSDFKEAIKGNVLTEVQMHTKSLADLSRIEKKYGLEYAKRVAREEVGIGMMQNPKYNKGRPWFIAFRPPLHMPHKIPDEEMRRYKEYTEIIGKIELRIVELENKGKDMTDSKIELKLAKTKLKQGRFRMAEIYITSLRKRLGV